MCFCHILKVFEPLIIFNFCYFQQKRKKIHVPTKRVHVSLLLPKNKLSFCERMNKTCFAWGILKLREKNNGILEPYFVQKRTSSLTCSFSCALFFKVFFFFFLPSNFTILKFSNFFFHEGIFPMALFSKKGPKSIFRQPFLDSNPPRIPD